MGRRPSVPRKPKRFILGITGRMLSGKDTVCKILESRGFRVVDVDKIGHRVLEIRKEEILKMIDKNILDDEGKIDRKKLASIVFSDPMKLQVLNKLTHGTIKELVRLEIEKDGFYCINAALLFEIGLNQFCNLVVYINSSEDNILLRAKMRGFDEEDVKRRISFQKKLEDVINEVKIVINNNGTIEDLQKEIEEKIFSIVKL
ncbi:MAG: dephospho-CoA kinase [Brevinematales bacterium]|nr:dephospho-CoA kinase [Brevinematales bacterium]